LLASNRVGVEIDEDSQITFYGSSFMTGAQGQKIVEADRSSETVLLAEYDLDELEQQRIEWGIFRDRRPELYSVISSNDGELTL